MAPEVLRLSHDQSGRRHVYCVRRADWREHMTVTDPLHPWSGDPHVLIFGPCTCSDYEAPSAE